MWWSFLSSADCGRPCDTSGLGSQQVPSLPLQPADGDTTSPLLPERHGQKYTTELGYSTPTRHSALYTPHAGAAGDNRSDTEKQLWLGKRTEAPGGALGAGVRRELFKGPPDEWPNGGRPVPAALCGPPPPATAAGNRGGMDADLRQGREGTQMK